MPDLTVINNLEESIHVAFFVLAPISWKNNLGPGERWTTHLPTLPLHFQVRWAERTDKDGNVYQSQEFSPGQTWEMGATIGLACAAGTASVVMGTTGLATGQVGLMGISAPLMAAACAGGEKFASIGADAKMYETVVWVPWFEHKEFSVRGGGGGCHLWDNKENRQV